MAAVAVLLGGHAFGVEAARLLPWLYGTIGTGAVLWAIEAYPNWRSWLFECRTAMIVLKLALLCLVPFFWNYRVAILLAVLVIGSAGSHLPRKIRHYSWLERRVITEPKGNSG
ncbi:MAG: hypothetical protein ABFD86_00245 [Bryobacteraceae bacterium]